MGNFCGSNHWAGQRLDVTQLFTVANTAARVALGNNVAGPTQANPGDIAIQTDTTQWYIMATKSTPSVDGDWTAITAQTAGLIANVPAGTIAAVTVQGAINELDTEKAALAGANFTGLVDVTLGAPGPGLTTGVGTDIVSGNNVQSGVIATAAPAAGDVIAAARAIGETGLQAGVTAGDRVITRVGEAVVGLAGNGALGAGATADETLAVAGMPAGAVILGYNLSAAPVAGSVWSQARNDGAGNIVIRYGNITAAPIAVAADAAVIVQWMLTVAI